MHNTSHQQPHLYMLPVLTHRVLVHQFTLHLKMAAVQGLVPASLPHTYKTAKAHFTRAYQASQLGPNYLKRRENSKGQAGREK